MVLFSILDDESDGAIAIVVDEDCNDLVGNGFSVDSTTVDDVDDGIDSNVDNDIDGDGVGRSNVDILPFSTITVN